MVYAYFTLDGVLYNYSWRSACGGDTWAAWCVTEDAINAGYYRDETTPGWPIMRNVSGNLLYIYKMDNGEPITQIFASKLFGGNNGLPRDNGTYISVPVD